MTVAKMKKKFKKMNNWKIYKFFPSQNKSNFDMEVKQRIKGDVASMWDPPRKFQAQVKESQSQKFHVEFMRQ